MGILCSFLIPCLNSPARGQALSQAVPLAVPYYSPPNRMELCGESVPLHSQDVKERLDREFTIVVYNHAQVYLWLKRLERYFPWLERQLALKNLPQDLKYVAVAESDLMVSACSPAGAVGPWQFISSTGSNYGLDQSKQVDERRDFEKATESAFRYLQDLHGIFQNWTLAVAAYNCGEKRVQDEMRKQKVPDYYSLKLPLETERYILRILAIKEVLSHPERYGYHLPEGAGYPEVRLDKVNIRLPHPVSVQALAEAAGITYRDFKIMNASFISDTIPEGSHAMNVPQGGGKEFTARVETIKAESKPIAESNRPRAENKPRLVKHKVAKGETLTGIAAHYKVTVQDLRELNQIRGEKVKPGQVLKISK
jgi:membrane-bound lytic murein transglycosylase D